VSATARSNDFVVDVERLIIRYDFADFFKVSAGRYHTPHSFWNTEYHHGLWLQTTTARPEMIRFGSMRARRPSWLACSQPLPSPDPLPLKRLAVALSRSSCIPNPT
jgi:hypothetical protein